MSSPNKISFPFILIFLLVSLSALEVAESSYFRLKHSVILPAKLATAEAHGMGKVQEITERNRRVLAGANHISYGALSANRVPCNRRGQSYYNCGASGRANPYQRSCNAATRCARH